MTLSKWRRAVACAIVGLALLAPGIGLAAAKVRVEWVRGAPSGYAAGAVDGSVRVFLGQETVSSIASTPVLTAAAPDFKTGDYNYRNGLARVTVISGAVIASWGATPTVSETTGTRISAGQTVWIAVETGQKLAFVEAADQPTPNNAAAYPASGKTAVTASLTSATSSGAFTPFAGRPFNVSLSGTFVATCGLQKSFNAGSTWLDVTYVDGSALTWSAPVLTDFTEGEASVQWRVNCSAYTSGTVVVRISQ